MMYKLIILNIVLYFEKADMQYTIKNFQNIYLAPSLTSPSLYIKPPSRVLEINKPPGGPNREFTVYIAFLIAMFMINTKQLRGLMFTFVCTICMY